MPRVTFYQLFRIVDINTIEVLRNLRIGAANLQPGDIIRKGTIVGGIDLFNYKDAEIEGDEDSGTWIVRRIYGK